MKHSFRHLLLPFFIVILFAGSCKPEKMDQPQTEMAVADEDNYTDHDVSNGYEDVANDVEKADNIDDRHRSDAYEAGQQEHQGIADASHRTLDNLLPAPIKDRPEQRLQRKGYNVSYNKGLRIPNWVQWTLTADHTYGRYKRKGQAFHEDEDVPSPRATHYDYMRSGYDRGHMCPSGDNKWDPKAQEESFLLTNICPQNHNLNKYEWNDLEMLCRDWARQYGVVDIVCGPVYYKDADRKYIGRNRLPVPDAFFKVVLCRKGTPKAIGFIYPNDGKKRSMSDCVRTVDEVERITRIDFFPALSDDIENRVEAKANLKAW